MHRLLLAAVLLSTAARATAQPSADSTRSLPPLPSICACRVSSAIHVDGRLDEASWEGAEPATVFTQLDPHEGSPASESTAVRVLIGGDALFIGARLLDRDASRIRARLARRDDPVESDVFDVYIDSYHDRLTAWHFRVNPAGAIYDATVGADGGEDASWDPVWESAARVDGGGWTAEIRIPLSQLRYTPADDAVFGVQFDRTIFRTGEVDLFAFTPKSETSGVSRYGTLTCLGRLPAPHRIELLPYAAARNERLLFPPNDPFRSGNDMFGASGADMKYGLSSSFTLDATVNPDFGQVEVDPAEVNLTAFETFFPEKRQFFIEGSDLFTFARTRSFNNYGFVRVFHSRRIGRAPQRALSPATYDYVDAPTQTTILGAAKVAGRTPSGWSLGVLDALTAKEDARVIDAATQDQARTTVEPFTHYLVARATRDLRQGNTKVGAILTSVNRRLDDPAVTGLYRNDAYLGGLDLNHAWAHRRYAVDADVSVSQIRGSSDAIALAQRSSVRYYQRPDHADYAVYDPTRTSLTGYAADASFAKTAGQHSLWSLAYSSKSPGYEVNDVGFSTRSDYRALSEIYLFTQNKPGKIFRSWTAFPFFNQTWNFGGDIIYNGAAADAGGTLRNYWAIHGRYTQAGRSYDDRLTRGGPQARLPRTFNWTIDCTSDSRKSWSMSPSYSHSWNDRGGEGDAVALSVSARPSPTVRVSAGPQYSWTHALGQYVATIPDDEAVATYGGRYVFATLDQRSVSLDLRLDWTFTPRLSLQFYAQPLLVAADFHNLKEFTTPRDFLFAIYGVDRGTITRDANGVYTIDPGTGRTFTLRDPDFDLRSLLGNAVLRWEYRPGSTLFVVWQHRRADVEPIGEFRLGHDLDALWNADAENVIAVKATYWIGL